MSRALITGAAGFIGGGLTRRLLGEGWEVHVLLGRTCRRETLADVEGRVIVHNHDGSMDNMLALMDEARPDVVFHLAALFLAEHRTEDIGNLVFSNILFSTQLVEAMRAHDVRRLVNTGTSWQHFGTVDYRPVNLYAATKQAFEDILAYYHAAAGISCITLKLYDTYGPGDRRRKLIHILIDAARTGELLAMSPGEQEVDLTHVTDVTAAFGMAAQLLLQSDGPIFTSYLISGTRLTVRELVKQVAQATDSRIQVQWGGRSYRKREVMVPVSKGRRLPGWTPQISLPEGLAGLAREGNYAPGPLK